MRRLLALLALVVLVVELFTSRPSITAVHASVSRPTPTTTLPTGELTGVKATLLADGLSPLTDVVGSPIDDSLFLVEKTGRVLIYRDGTVLADPFLDISRWVLSEGNEQGLLTLTFHPDFAENRRAFIFFTDQAGDSELMEVRASASDSDRADLASLRQILEVPQNQQYHQSGSMAFGPNGYLWVSIGDGGGIGDPYGNGQNPGNLYATILRLDVDDGSPYGIPADNPFVGSSGGQRPEVWAYGVRNPWRISIDAPTGNLYVPDVGQETSEELDVLPLSRGGVNLGWSITEGTLCYQADTCDTSGITMPVFEYRHEGDGCAMVGGGVYRGLAMPELQGQFFYADYCLGWVRSLVYDGSEVVGQEDWTDDLGGRKGNVSTLGTDRHGEMYIVNLDGEVWRIDPVRDGG